MNIISIIDLADEQNSYLCPEGSKFPSANNLITFQGIKGYCPEGNNMALKKCNAIGCDGVVHAKDVCHKHYLQLKRHGKIFERTQYDFNEITIEGDIAYIQLYNKQNEPTVKTTIDADDVERAKNHRWGFRGKGYVNNPNKVLLHRFIINAKDGDITDHINRDKLDNRKANLRFVSLSENVHNSKIPITNKSGVKGVHFHKASGGWEASIQINGIKRSKLFRTFDEAVKYRKEHEVI